MLTINPARILGIDDKVGSLEEGKLANVIVCTKSLVELGSRIHTVIIKGNVIPMTSCQTRLRAKLEKIVKDGMKQWGGGVRLSSVGPDRLIVKACQHWPACAADERNPIAEIPGIQDYGGGRGSRVNRYPTRVERSRCNSSG